ncbi:MAG: DUF4160 domain-containing protein [Promethearchaeota archaeon]
MPEISRFFGIVIYIFYLDHNPPHFHAKYNEYEAIIQIESLSVIAGNLPPRALGMVMEWAAMHQEEILKNWRRAENFEKLKKIQPLK